MFPFVQLGRNIDRRFNGGIAGFLGDQYNPFEVHDDPSAATFRVRDLSIADEADRAGSNAAMRCCSEVDQLPAARSRSDRSRCRPATPSTRRPTP